MSPTATIYLAIARAVSPGKSEEAKADRQNARSWLMDGNTGFEQVCCQADMNPDTIREIANAKIAAFEKHMDCLRPDHNAYIDGEITRNGKTQSIADWSKELGLNKHTLRGRLNRGSSIERALTPGRLPLNWSTQSRLEKTFTFKGKTKTLQGWSKETGIKLQTLRHRIRSGWTVEDALGKGLSKKGDRKKLIDYDGLSLTYEQWAQRIGITTDALKQRFWRGWNIEQALTTPAGRWQDDASEQSLKGKDSQRSSQSQMVKDDSVTVTTPGVGRELELTS